MKPSVAIIDSGGANISSLVFALERLDVTARLTTDAALVRNASHVILPGVGAAADAMARLRQSGLDEVIPRLTQPVLGICLGMQLLAERSAEHDTECLGILPGTAGLLPAVPGHPVPNMGWCEIQRQQDHPLLDGIDDGSWFYFVHSYALPPGTPCIATARHAEEFGAIAAHDNFYAAQCHPERSAHSGARLLQNFLKLNA